MSISLLVITLKFSIGFFLAIILGVVFREKGESFKKNALIGLKVSLVYVLISFIYIYFVLPSQSLNQLLFYNLIGLILGSLFTFATSFTEKTVINQGSERKKREFTFQKSKQKLLVFSVLTMIIFLIGTPIMRIFSIDEIYETIPVKKVEQTEELKSTKETPIAMSTKSARNKMQKMMSSVPNYSGYQLGTTTAQLIDGEYVYIAGLEYRGFWKWNINTKKYLVISK